MLTARLQAASQSGPVGAPARRQTGRRHDQRARPAAGFDLLEAGPTAEVRRAADLHDVGKLGVPNSILDKPGKLTEAEFSVVRRHPEMTHRILTPIPTFARGGRPRVGPSRATR